MTQSQIAARLGVSQASISRRFTGEVVLDLDELEALADLLGVPPSELLEPEPVGVREKADV